MKIAKTLFLTGLLLFTTGLASCGGNGGNSYYRQLQRDGDMKSSHIGKWTDEKYNWDGFIPLATHYDDGSEDPINDQEANKTRKIYNKGYHAEYEFAEVPYNLYRIGRSTHRRR